MEKLTVSNLNLAQIVSLFFFCVFIYLSEYIPISYRYDIYYILPMSMVIFSLSFSNSFLGRILSSKFLVLLGESSFALYMIHQIIIRGLIKLNGKLNILNDLSLLALILISSMLFSLLLYKFYEIPAKRMTLSFLGKLHHNNKNKNKIL
nr:acyltransferase family protein [uncultured Moellerella sp.]